MSAIREIKAQQIRDWRAELLVEREQAARNR
ncbi:MAG: hypothetical protein KatS3mg082_0843 [Nitrospiraceae bacterium]|nr:MAG: hypothetical protein KatS3mg082_0843 [Nitrospiraceae bacterium]